MNINFTAVSAIDTDNGKKRIWCYAWAFRIKYEAGKQEGQKFFL
jgi:hypothetical protein